MRIPAPHFQFLFMGGFEQKEVTLRILTWFIGSQFFFVLSHCVSSSLFFLSLPHVFVYEHFCFLIEFFVSIFVFIFQVSLVSFWNIKSFVSTSSLLSLYFIKLSVSRSFVFLTILYYVGLILLFVGRFVKSKDE